MVNQQKGVQQDTAYTVWALLALKLNGAFTSSESSISRETKRIFVARFLGLKVSLYNLL